MMNADTPPSSAAAARTLVPASILHDGLSSASLVLPDDDVDDEYDADGTRRNVNALMIAAGLASAVVSFGLFCLSELLDGSLRPGLYFAALVVFAGSIGVNQLARDAPSGGPRERSIVRDSLHCGDRGRPNTKLSFRQLALQTMAWCFAWLSVLLPTIPLVAASVYPKFALEGFAICGGAACILTQVAMISAMLQHDYGAKEVIAGSSSKTVRQLKIGKGEKSNQTMTRKLSDSGFLTDSVRKLANEQTWAGYFVALQVLVSSVACLLSFGTDIFFGDTGPSMWLLGGFSFACIVLSTTLTHGVAGKVRNSRKSWTFFQPLEGGNRFVQLQAVGWTLFAISIYLFLMRLGILPGSDVYAMLMEVIINDPTLGTTTLPFSIPAIFGMVAQILIAASITRFEPDQGSAFKSITNEELALHPFLVHSPFTVLQVLLCYNMEKVMLSFHLFSMIFVRVVPTTVIAIWITAFVLYIPTYSGSPSKTGRRSLGNWDDYKFDALAKYFDFHIERRSKTPLNPQEKYVFGYHPHGIIPLTIAWAPFTAKWGQLLPGINPALLVSSVLHYIPLMRDVAQLFRAFEVSYMGYSTALAKHNSVVLVPGGQTEMVYSKSQQPSTLIDTTHRGFIRVAMREAFTSRVPVHVCPLYGFGETEVFDNLSIPQRFQEAAIRSFRANVIFFPWGVFGIPGFPRPIQLTIGVGKPILVPPVENPTDSQVALVHQRYMDELLRTFNEFESDSCQAGTKLEFFPKIDHLSPNQFEAEWNAVKSLKNPVVRKYKSEKNYVESFFIGGFYGLSFLLLLWTASYYMD